MALIAPKSRTGEGLVGRRALRHQLVNVRALDRPDPLVRRQHVDKLGRVRELLRYVGWCVSFSSMASPSSPDHLVRHLESSALPRRLDHACRRGRRGPACRPRREQKKVKSTVCRVRKIFFRAAVSKCTSSRAPNCAPPRMRAQRRWSAGCSCFGRARRLCHRNDTAPRVGGRLHDIAHARPARVAHGLVDGNVRGGDGGAHGAPAARRVPRCCWSRWLFRR